MHPQNNNNGNTKCLKGRKKERRLKTTTSAWFYLTHLTETCDVKFQLSPMVNQFDAQEY